MLLLETKYPEIVNHTIYYLLKYVKKRYGNDTEEVIDHLIIKYLRREQFNNCKNAFNNLFYWLQDGYDHSLDNLTKFILYSVLKNNHEFVKLKQDTEYQVKLNKLLEKYELDKNKIKRNIYNLNWYLKIFANEKFLTDLDTLYQKGSLEKYLDENPQYIKEYIDILPKKIQKKFNKYSDLYLETDRLINYFCENMKNKNFVDLFWNDTSAKNEEEIQNLVKCLLDAYFYKQDIDINREVVYGNGKIDFKFYKNGKEIVIIEFKMAKSSYLVQGYESQLVQYMKSTHCQKAYYIILCFTQQEIKKAEKFIKNRKITNSYHELIQLVTFDLCKENKIVSNKYESIKNPIDQKIEYYFEYLVTIKKIRTKNELLTYLKKIKKHFYKIENLIIKKTYIKKFHKIVHEIKKSTIDLEKFYKIYNQNALYFLMITLLQDIINIETFKKVIEECILYLENLIPEKNKERINEKNIVEIFNFLKKYHSNFYIIIKKIQLQIYIIDAIDLEYNISVIPCLNCQEFIIVCTYMKEDHLKNLSNPIYTFLWSLASILYWRINKENLNLIKSFLIQMTPYTKNLKEDSLEAIQLFLDSVVMYLLHNTYLDKFNPFQNCDEKIYIQLKNFFDPLLESVVNSYDYI